VKTVFTIMTSCITCLWLWVLERQPAAKWNAVT